MKFQLTRPVWGEPELYAEQPVTWLNFNSLAPCGANLKAHFGVTSPDAFQLTRPVWGEPRPFFDVNEATAISTHSPRVGRTPQFVVHLDQLLISTHSPRVGRTMLRERVRHCPLISTHSPRVGRTVVINSPWAVR